MQLDLSSFDSIKQFAKDLREDKGRLDFVVANAGVMKVKYEQTKDGYEQTLQVNGIGTGLMSVLVLPKLEETAGMDIPEKSRGIKPSLCVVASEGEFNLEGRMDPAEISPLLGKIPPGKRPRIAHR